MDAYHYWHLTRYYGLLYGRKEKIMDISRWLIQFETAIKKKDLSDASALLDKAQEALNLQETISFYEQAWTMLQEVSKTGDLARNLSNNLAELYSGQGKYEQAEALLQHALTLDERAYG